jgi:hypothetical protein
MIVMLPQVIGAAGWSATFFHAEIHRAIVRSTMDGPPLLQEGNNAIFPSYPYSVVADSIVIHGLNSQLHYGLECDSIITIVGYIAGTLTHDCLSLRRCFAR